MQVRFCIASRRCQRTAAERHSTWRSMTDVIASMAKPRRGSMLNQPVFPDHSVVLITGAAAGIGGAIAELFLRRGAHVAAVDLKWSKQASDALSSALVIQADVSVEDNCIAAVAQV